METIVFKGVRQQWTLVVSVKAGRDLDNATEEPALT
jgi:hypothetical protein